ncbi:HAMP domain-containing histidine kinase [Listeria welshimeri]|uniref:sensor histidine kinase n=1 Tax=Listeria welshimeri TaxID=1643 RepID=UPI0016246679|nr:HAMP domain-containing sensor histidine kinase [Listeria welshimeri]MBC1251579.1 HAMP domain-containing histidine kinase [Listeria welshimeri]MBC1431651.1 HAMP domain-containing histidine kinase [Listeria welshimeri]MBC1465189.1 HAMP domain-containing histidine kinase [Listeria welshimeri]MBC1497597.1 HAMP domain-containing histidine kinase [Listeria welshimeri]MBC1518430.1 HAMP domain-containing histidine kinase [Listeria welshimeri]
MLAIKWMNKVKNKISWKIFLVFVSIILIFTTLVYAMLILFLPQFYYNYKTNQINDYADEAVKAGENGDLSNVEKALDEFMDNTNILPILTDSSGRIIYIPNVNMSSLNTAMPTIVQGSESESGSTATQYPEQSKTKNKSILVDGQVYDLSYTINVQKINDIANVLLQFAPYFVLFAFILSLLTAYFFSRRMVRPLLRMNKVAAKMAKLNFTEVLPIMSQDEIGQLSGNLNEMAINLEQTMLELNEVNEKLQKEIEKERQLEEMRKNFVTAISHELKSPLAAVMGQVEAMRYNVAPYDNHPKYLQESYQILEQMSKMIQEMLDVSKVEQTNHMGQQTMFSLTEMVETIINNKKTAPSRIDKKIIFESKEDVKLTANYAFTEKVIENIIENAFDYSIGDSEIIIDLRNRGEGFYFSVHNKSARIPEEELGKLFEPFYRLEKSGNKKTGGTGLGLFIIAKFLNIQAIQYKLINENDGVTFQMWR